MTCQELASFLLDYLEGDLPAETREPFEEHLSLCPNCVRYVEQYEATVRAGRAAFREPEAEVPGDVPEELVRAILRAQGLKGPGAQG